MEKLNANPKPITSVDSLQELCQLHHGTAKAIQNIFDHHYYQMLRDIRQELQITYGNNAQTIWDNISDNLYDGLENQFGPATTLEDFIENLNC